MSKNIKTALAVVIFLITAAFTLPLLYGVISPGDGPEFAVSAYILGISHPPGYPVWVLTGKLFSRLPLGNIGLRVNLVSLFSIAGAVCVLFLSLSQRLRPRYAVTGSLALALSLPILKTVSGAEVYPQLILLVVLIYYLLNRVRSQPNLKIFSLLSGLGIAIHYLSVLFIPGWLISLSVQSKTFRFSAKGFIKLLFLLLGLSVFTVLPVRAVKAPYLSWGRVERYEHFAEHLQRSAYFDLERASLANWKARKQYALEFFDSLFTTTYPYGGALLLLTGLIAYALNDKKRLLALLSIFLLPVGLIIMSLRFSFTPFNLARLHNYYLPVYPMGAVLIAHGYEFLDRKISRYWRIGFFLIIVLSLICFLKVNRPIVDQSNNYQVLDLGNNLCRQLPESTIFFTKSDPITFPMWFMQAVNGKRQDISIITTSFMQPSQYYWYRYHIRDYYPWMFVNPSEAELRDKIRGINPWINEIIAKFANQMPLYYELNIDLLISNAYLFQRGITYRIQDPVSEAPKIEVSARLVDYYTRQKGIAAFKDYISPKIRETAFLYAISYFYLAEDLRKSGQPEGALYYLKRALAIYPEIIYFKGSEGLIYEAMGEDEKAARVFRGLLRKHPDYQLANLAMSRISIRSKEEQNAKRYLRNFRETIPVK